MYLYNTKHTNRYKCILVRECRILHRQREEVDSMERTRQLHLTAKEVSLLLNRSLSYSYDVIAKMNEELKSKGMYVMTEMLK